MSDEKNPIDDFLEEKVANLPHPQLQMPAMPSAFRQAAGAFGGAVKDQISGGGIGKSVGEGLGKALANGAVALGLGATVAAASKIHDAITKTHDFKRMLAFNPDLDEHHQSNPNVFNQYFTTLREMNPHFTRDPLIAGSYMRMMVDNPSGAAMKAVEAGTHRKDFNDSLGSSIVAKGLKVG